jgi:energy-coupling factor transport system ATP-binding protein
MTSAIEFDDVTVTYPGAARPAIRDVRLQVPEGELCLVVGPTGAGKSTLLRAACALVPHFTGGTVAGHVRLVGRDTRDHLPRDLADVVGVVGQDPAAGFVTDTVEEELAYSMEQLGLTPAVMRKRVEEVLDLLGLAALRDRPLAQLSGGEQQRVAIGSVLTAHPRVLVLDEPTSALDPAAAEDVLAALTRLVHDLGLTVLLAEHRLERVVQFADRVVAVAADGTVTDGAPAEMLAHGTVVPPIVALGRWARWSPLPLSVRDARRRAPELRARMVVAPQSVRPPLGSDLLVATGVHVHHGLRGRWRRRATGSGGSSGAVHAVRGVDLTVRSGDVVAVMGRNGSGKTSLLWALQGSGSRSAGTVLLDGPGTGSDGPVDPSRLTAAEARRRIALVPHNPLDLLYRETVGQECAAVVDASAETVRAILDDLAPGIPDEVHPRDLSEGQRLALALAVQMAAAPPLLVLDEPTRGLDYSAKLRLATVLVRHTSTGGGVVLSSHDVEFVAECASRVVVLADGEVVADDEAATVLVSSPTFAPQVAKILHPLPLLTVAQAIAAMPESA